MGWRLHVIQVHVRERVVQAASENGQGFCLSDTIVDSLCAESLSHRIEHRHGLVYSNHLQALT